MLSQINKIRKSITCVAHKKKSYLINNKSNLTVSLNDLPF